MKVLNISILNCRLLDRLCLLINIMLIIMFVLSYAYFPIFLIFLSVYCNVMFAIIKKEGKKNIKLYFG